MVSDDLIADLISELYGFQVGCAPFILHIFHLFLKVEVVIL